MRIAIINLTGGGMSGGYRKYLRNVIPRMASNPDVETLLCAFPESLNVQAWLNPLPNVEFVNCKPYHFLRHSPDSALKRHLERFSPNVIFVPVERFFRFKKIPVVNMLQNMEPFVTNIGGNSFSTRLRQWVQSVDGKHAIKNADRVIALSKFVSDVLTKRWGVPNERISLGKV